MRRIAGGLCFFGKKKGCCSRGCCSGCDSRLLVSQELPVTVEKKHTQGPTTGLLWIKMDYSNFYHRTILYKKQQNIHIIDNLQLQSFPNHFSFPAAFQRLIGSPNFVPQEGVLRVSCLAYVRQVRSNCAERSCAMGQVAPARRAAETVEGW